LPKRPGKPPGRPPRSIAKSDAKGKTQTLILPSYDGWMPREDQLDLWYYLQRGGKRAVEVAHRRWGKDEIALRWILQSAFTVVGNYWHMLPLNNQGRKAIWEAVTDGQRRIDRAFPLQLRSDTRETDMFIRFRNGSTYQVLGSDNYRCYSEDTEVLTTGGWRLFSELSGKEEVATLDDGELIYSPINAVVSYTYNGKMYTVSNNAIDLMVTPNHQFFVQSSKGFNKFKRIDDPTILRDKIPATCTWVGRELEYYELPKVENIHPCTNGTQQWNLKFKMDDWCAFVGIYLAEGSTFSNSKGNFWVYISQKKENVRRDIEALLSRMGLKYAYSDNPGTYIIRNKQLFQYVKQFGKQDKRYIPRDLLELCPRQLNILMTWMVKGDGSVNKNNTLSYTSISKQLIGDFQELAIKVGLSGNVHTYKMRPGGKIHGRQIVSMHQGYTFTRRISKFKYFRDTYESYISQVDYSGKVWCIDAGSHVIKVRRNGKEAWCGNSLLGSPPVGVVFSEFATANPKAWGEISPILVQNKGWAVFIGVPYGDNHFKRLYDFSNSEEGIKDGWRGELKSAYETPVFTREELEAEKRNYIAMYGEDEGMAKFNSDYLCSFQTVVLGSYFGHEMRQAWEQKRITKVPWRPDLEVDTFWDIGVDDATSIWFMQRVGRAYLFIDYYEATGYAAGHFARVLKEKPYIYGNHWMPHDVEQRHPGQEEEIARSVREVYEGLGIKPVITVKRPKNMDTIVFVNIPAVRNVLPQCWFDETNCAQGIAGLENYRAEYDDEKQVQSNRPEHNWASHPASAFMSFATGYKLMSDTKIQTTSEIMGGIHIYPFAG
jgi:LAGLIDADG-like domain